MIVLTANNNLDKLVFVSKVGDLNCKYTHYYNGEIFQANEMAKDEAFDLIQNCIKAGWKQGE